DRALLAAREALEARGARDRGVAHALLLTAAAVEEERAARREAELRAHRHAVQLAGVQRGGQRALGRAAGRRGEIVLHAEEHLLREVLDRRDLHGRVREAPARLDYCYGGEDDHREEADRDQGLEQETAGAR